MAEKSTLQQAIDQLRANGSGYAKYERYYDGNHDLAFATDKFKNAFGALFREFAMNLCPAVVEAVRDKLVIDGFRVEAGDEDTESDAWKIWQANRMGKRAGEIHREAILTGDAYAMVWVDPAGAVTIYPQRAANCTVRYDEETPGKIIWAAKYWATQDKRIRLNLYFPEVTLQYVSKAKPESDATPTLPDNEKELIPFADLEAIANPYGQVPVFHFANNSSVGSFGRSELKDVIAIQDGLNKAVLDMMVAMEFAAYRQRWASGIEIEYDDNGNAVPPYKAGVERLWLAESETAKFGDFEASDLKQFLEVKDAFKMDFAAISGTPLYYFMQTGANFPQSGESYRRSETRFVQKVRDRMEAFGNTWEDVMSFAVKIEKGRKDIRLFTKWEDPGRLTEKEELENLILKRTIGVSDEQLLTEAGYGEAEVQQMLAQKEAQREAMVTAFNRGEEPEDDETGDKS